MKKIYLISIAVLSVCQFTYAQNTFPVNGNVGIGGTDSNAALTIIRGGTNSGNDYPALHIETSGTGNLYGPILYLNGVSGSGGRMWGIVSSGSLDAQATGAAGNFAIYDGSGGGSRLVINSAGNVGIGTTSPSSLFSVSAPAAGFNVNIYSPAINAGDINGIKLYNGYGIYENKWAGIANVAEDIYSNHNGLALYSQNAERMRISGLGNILIGETTQVNTSYLLDVNGTARARGIVVNATGADFVFKLSYKLYPLSYLKKYIDQNHHLPEIPSAKQMQADGLNLGENQVKLLQKVEELTLYLIQKDKEIKKEQTKNAEQDKENADMLALLKGQTEQIKIQQNQISLLSFQLNTLLKTLNKNGN